MNIYFGKKTKYFFKENFKLFLYDGKKILWTKTAN